MSNIMGTPQKIKTPIRARISDLYIFGSVFLALAILLTVQMLILGEFVDYSSVTAKYVVLIVLSWITVAVLCTLLIHSQIQRRVLTPIEKFAQATRRVANGDFSVFIPPRHRLDRLDFMDIMFRDFNTMVEELGSIETLKTEFFSNVSHEIKTPLSVIQNYAEMLQKANLTVEQQRSYAESIISASRRLSNLITNMLKLSKLEKQGICTANEPYDLCRQLCDCALLFENQWEQKNIEFIVDIEDQATLNADASLMEIAWNNLLANAIKFSEPGGTVSLTQTSTADEIVVSVVDSGCGMNAETQRRIFDKFYQGDTSHSTEGNGLGLALVSRIIDLADGSIAVKSEIDRGSTFVVRLPLEREAK